MEDLSLNAGEKLIEGSITAQCLNVQQIFADEALVGAIKAANIDVAELFASDAAVGVLRTYDVRSDSFLQLTVGTERKTVMRLSEAGMRLGEDDSDYNLFLDTDSLDIQQNGATIASFAYNKLWTQAAEVRDSIELGIILFESPRTADWHLAYRPGGKIALMPGKQTIFQGKEGDGHGKIRHDNAGEIYASMEHAMGLCAAGTGCRDHIADFRTLQSGNVLGHDG